MGLDHQNFNIQQIYWVLNAIANHYGIYFGKEKQFLDNKTIVTHHAENCQSNQIYKGILTDEANATYLSNTYVNPEAQKNQRISIK